MSSATSYRINEPGVISEVIEGEAIVLNFESGTYYSLNASCQALWEDVSAGVAAGALPERLAARYPDAGPELAGAVESVLRQLLDERLIVPAGGAPAAPPPARRAEGAYEPPRLQKYTDLQELLLLDPIHDLDESGRPLANG